MSSHTKKTPDELLAEIGLLNKKIAALEATISGKHDASKEIPVDTLLRMTFEQPDHQIYIFNVTDDKYLYLSSNIKQFTGNDTNTCLSHNSAHILEHIHPDDRTEYHMMFNRVSSSDSTHYPSAITYRRMVADGTYRWFREHLARISIAHSDNIYVIGTAADISAQVITTSMINNHKQTYAKLTQQYTTILDAIPDVLIHVNTELDILWANKAAAASLNKTIPEITGKRCYTLWGNRTSPCEDCPVQKSIRTGKPESSIIDIHETSWNIRAIPIIVDNSNVLGTIEIACDITSRPKYEQEHQKSKTLQSLGTLAGGIAHDFNNILTGILGNIGLSKLYLDSKDEAYQLLTQAEQVASQARRLTGQLMTFSEGGSPVKKPTDMKTFIHSQVEKAAVKPSIECIFQFADTLNPCEIDETQFEHVIRNIVTNALDAMKDSGTLTINAMNISIGDERPVTLPEGDYIKLSISDNGYGIPDEHVERVFDPYFTTKDIGHGLGLAIVYSIIRKHDGHITVTSKQGKGTTFTIYIPSITLPIASLKQTKYGTNGKILLMDNDQVIRASTGKLLIRHGYEVETASDGKSAIALFRSAYESGIPFDIVILDISVTGGMDGGEVLKTIRQIEPRIKAIVSSGYNDDPCIVDYHEYGFHGKTENPYLISNLTQTINDILNDSTDTTKDKG